MKNFRFSILFTIILASVSLFSCEDEKMSIPPTFKGFKHSPEIVHAGDEVTIVAYTDQPGKYVYGPRYTWTISMDTLSSTATSAAFTYTTVQDAYISDGDPKVSFKIPQNVITSVPVRVNFKADYNNAVDADERLILPCIVQDGYEGTFNSSEVLSTLYSIASGSMSFYVK